MASARYRLLVSDDDVPVLDNPGTIRWATLHPDGRRSNTWQVVGARNSDDVFVGARGQMKDTKLSLHKSGIWRWAFTKPAAAKYSPPGTDSAMIRYTDVPYIAPGWRHAANIRTPTDTLAPPFDEPVTSDGKPILLVPTPPEPLKHRDYQVLLGDDPQAALTINDAFDVGRMTLKSGLRVWIVATEWEPQDNTRDAITAIRKLTADHPDAAVGIISGDVDGVPMLLDVRGLNPENPGG